MMTIPQVLIIGGGFAGLKVAKSLKNANVNVLLVDKSNHHLFQPLLYQVASATLSPADIGIPLREILKNQKNTQVIMGEVVSIDKINQCATLKSGELLKFDYLVLAVGAKHAYFGNEHWESFAPGLKTIQDALQIRENILISFEKAERLDNPTEVEKHLTFVVVGAGPTGVEMAGAIAEIAHKTMFKNFRKIKPEKAKIYLIEAAPQTLPMYSPNLAAKAEKTLEKMGVVVIKEKKVINITKDGVQVEETFIPTTNVIWAAGNKAPAFLTCLNTPLDKQQRVVVGPDLTIPGHPNIFVLGDCASALDAHQKPLPGVASVAIQQGQYVGKILKNLVPEDKRKPFVYFDKGSLATIGKAKAIAKIGKLELSGFIAWFLWCFIHIVYLIGFRNRFSVMLEWITLYLTGNRGVRLIYNSIESYFDKDTSA